jgi:ankyrin repeat protein
LLKAGADVNAIGGQYGTPLQAAAWAEDMETVRILLNAGADVTSEVAISGFYGTALQAAAAVESVEIVRELLDAGAAVNVSPAHGTLGCALSAAACVENETEDGEIAKLLLEHGADVNFEGGYHHLPLMSAAQVDNHAILESLLEHGADARGRGGQWGTTLTAAAHGNSIRCFKTLVDHGADIHATGGIYGSPLQAAAIKADMELIDYILDHAPELVNFRDGKYHTPLIAAAYFGRSEVVEKLLNIGANFQFQGGKFRSVITAAAIKGHKAILEKFLNMGPNEQLLDEALVEAVAHRQATSVDLLLQSRANVMARHPTLGTPSDALEAPEIVEENSDDEEEEEDSDNEGESDDEEEEVEWE